MEMYDLTGWVSNPDIRKMLIVVVGFLFLRVLVGLARKSVLRHVEDSGARYRARKLVTMSGYAAFVFFLAVVFSDKLGGLGVAFGVVGAGVAFALQEVIASFAGWIAITFARFYNVGDRVQLGGVKGDVVDVGILRTTLMEIGQWVNADQYSGRIVRIANSFVFKEPVFNYSAHFPFVWDEVVVPVKYGSNHRLARDILYRIADEVTREYLPAAKAEWENMTRLYMIEHARVEPAVTLIANDNWLEFTVRYVVDTRKRRLTKDEIFTRVLEAFDRTKGEVEFGSSTVQLVGVPLLEVSLEKRNNKK